MSDSIAGLAQSIVSNQSSATRETIQNIFARKQADSEKAVAQLIQQGAEAQKAALPEGQGRTIDVLA